MIAYIKGTIIEKDNQTVVVDVNNIGYEVFITTKAIEQATVGSEQKYYTYHSVKESAEELYGFNSLAGKRLFELLISVQGVGPKAALAILSLSDTETVRNAIANSDSAFISKAAGVGKKTAERVAVDLHDKVGLATNTDSSTAINVASANNEALDALIALGFNLNDSTALLKDVPNDLPVAEQVRLALKQRY